MTQRIIKFRAWDGEEMLDQFDWIKRGWYPIEEIRTEKGIVHWMQYTGLTDHNGKEIYEGDIVKIDRNHNMFPINQTEGSFNIKVKYIDVMFYPLYIVGGDCEIIGNVFENPELLTP